MEECPILSVRNCSYLTSDTRYTAGIKGQSFQKPPRCWRFKGAPAESGKRKGRAGNNKREKKTDLKAQQIIFICKVTKELILSLTHLSILPKSRRECFSIRLNLP